MSSTGEQLFQFSSYRLHLLARGQSLQVNVVERIVTLLVASKRVLAQCYFPEPAFRMLIVLLLADGVASYTVLTAGLYCTEACLKALVEHASLRVAAFEQLAARYHAEFEVLQVSELETVRKPVRRAIKDHGGLAEVLETKGFGWSIQTIYGRGYALVSGSADPDVAEL